jgi:hypothetical protein
MVVQVRDHEIELMKKTFWALENIDATTRHHLFTLWRWLGWSWLLISGYMHLASGLWMLLPIAPMDGRVIWQNSRPPRDR